MNIDRILVIVALIALIFILVANLFYIVYPSIQIEQPLQVPILVNNTKELELLQETLKINISLVKIYEERIKKLEDTLKFLEADYFEFKEFQKIGKGGK